MTTVGAAVHIHLEGTTQTRLVCVHVCVCVCVGGIVYTLNKLKAKPVWRNRQTGVLLILANNLGNVMKPHRHNTLVMSLVSGSRGAHDRSSV